MADRASRVAVIAVHGVADQQPGDSGAAIAALLANLDDDRGPAYGAFAVDPIRVPVRRIVVPDQAQHERLSFGDYVRAARDVDTPSPASGDEPAGAAEPGAAARPGAGQDANLTFMSSLVARYEPTGPDETYETTRLRGRRVATASSPPIDVDVYEMYWADLSRLTQSWLRMFAEVYQLLFHLGSLGVHAVRAGMAAETGVATPAAWERWAVAQRRAANLLAHTVLVLNLFMLGLLAVNFAIFPEVHQARTIAWVTYALIAAALVGVATYRGYTRGAVGVAIVLSLLLAGGIAAIAWSRPGSPDATYRSLATLALVVVVGVLTLTLRAYDRYRPGVARHGLLFGALVGVWVLVEIWIGAAATPGASVPAAATHGAELAYLLLRFCWLLFLIWAWIAFVAGRRVLAGARGDEAAHDRISRLNWTARLTLALPAVFFLLLTLSIWAALWPSVPQRLIDFPHTPLWLTRHVLIDLTPTFDIPSLARELMRQALGLSFGILAAMVAAALVVVLYAIAPSVLQEVRPVASPRDGSRLGQWLDNGFRAARWAGRGVVFGVLVVLPAGFAMSALQWLTGFTWPGWEGSQATLMRANDEVLVWVGTAIGVGGAGLVVFGARLKQLTLGFRSVIDVLLDVDNYLREHPRTATPRARIATRLASLLRHVHAQGYDRVVFVAHSQGSVIVADLLRFLHLTGLARQDPALAVGAATPVTLFTMGSPLRQLYGLRFPHLYHWARHPLRDRWIDPRERIAATTGPDPAELGLTRWVNAYRSGDYVGRYLWRPEACDFAYAVPRADTTHPWRLGAYPVTASETDPQPGNRREFCIGGGGHTHYWDRTAPLIAVELDRLIQP